MTRTFLLAFFCCLPLLSFSKTGSELHITLVIDTTITAHEISFEYVDLEIYNTKRKLVWTYENYSEKYSDKGVIQTLPPGNYTAVYENIFGRKTRQSFKITAGVINKLDIKVDQVTSYKHRTLKKLRDGEKLTIEVSTRGCFGGSIQEMCITRKGDVLTAVLYEINEHWDEKISDRVRDGKDLITTQVLDAAKQEIFMRFENELRCTVNGGCTTTVTYTVHSPYWSKVYKDGGCAWEGFDHLIHALFDDLDKDY